MSRFKFSFFCLLGFSLFFFTFKNVESSAVLAIVGKEKITLEEFNEKFNQIAKQVSNLPGKKVFLEDLIRYKIGVQEAERRNLRKDPLVQERFRQELYKALLEKELGPKVNKIRITESEMKSWYRKNPELRTSHILIQVKPNANKKERTIAYKRAMEIYSEVKKSKRPFKELVKLYSDDPLTKRVEGDLGYRNLMTAPSEEYYNTALKMRRNQVKGLIASVYGFHIIKLEGVQSYKNSNKNEIRAAIFNEKRKQLYDAFFNKLKRKYPIKKTSNVNKYLK